MRQLLGVVLLLLPLFLQSPASFAAETSAADDGIRVEFPKRVPQPADNPTTPEKVALGQQLYFDTRLSVNRKLSCNSCHDAMGSGADGKPFSPGHDGKLGGRNSPTVLNAAFRSVQFWDGRAASLEEQAKGPMTNPVEMGMPNHDAVVERLAKVPAYVESFKNVFGPGPITIENTVKAIAAYERTLVTPDSPYDRFVAGDKKALSASARKGMKLVTTVGCTSCHFGPMFAGPDLPQGQGFYMKFPTIPGSEYEAKYHLADDRGRQALTHQDSDKGMFRVPTWRNVAITAPYFHNGAVNTLDEAVRVMAKTQLGKTLPEKDVADIVAFLKSLTGKLPPQQVPTLPQD
jgi:cytochrome c peroxidase